MPDTTPAYYDMWAAIFKRLSLSVLGATMHRPNLLLTFLSVLAVALANTSGAPSSSCSSMKASGHNAANPAAGAGGYTMSFSAASYAAAGPTITVTIAGTTAYTGILLVAKGAASTTTYVGSFVSQTGYSATICTSHGITQTSKISKSPPLTYVWTPPAAVGSGTLTFSASIICSMNVYYLITGTLP